MSKKFQKSTTIHKKNSKQFQFKVYKKFQHDFKEKKIQIDLNNLTKSIVLNKKNSKIFLRNPEKFQQNFKILDTFQED